MHSRSRIRKFFNNFISLISGKFGGDLFLFVLFVMLSRKFGQRGIGEYSFAIAVTSFLAVACEFGLYQYTVKELSRSPSNQLYYGNVIVVRLLLSILGMSALVVVLALLPIEVTLKIVILTVGGYQVLYRLLNGFLAIFVAHEEMHWSGLLEFLLKLAAAGSCIVLIFLNYEMTAVLIAMPVVAFLITALAYYITSRKYGTPDLTINFAHIKATITHARTYATASMLSILSSRTDVILLGILVSTAAVGTYNVAYRFLFMIQFIPFYIGMALAPRAARLFRENRETLISLYHHSLRIIILVAVPTVIGIFLLADDLIGAIFSDEFTESILVLRLLCVALMALFLSHIYGVFLIACDMQRERTIGYALALVTSVVANLVMIPVMSYTGAAIAAVCSESILVVYFVKQLKIPLGQPKIRQVLLISLFGSVAFSAIVFYFKLSFLVAIPFSIIIYLTVVLCFQTVRNVELRFLLAILNVGRSGDSVILSDTRSTRPDL